MTLIIMLFLIAMVFIFIWVVYNRFVKQKNLILEAWGALDITLKKRHDLVPNLISVVKGISDHEKYLFTEITKWRSKSSGDGDVLAQKDSENRLSSLLGKINIVIENYPNLVSGPNYVKLQDQLMEIEDEISYARRYYNGTIRNNNILIESFPSNFIAKMFNFYMQDYFEIELSSEKVAPSINLDEE